MRLKPKRNKDNDLPGWASAVLPSTKIPDISDELAVLTNKVGSIRFAKKERSIIVPSLFLGYNRANRIGGVPTGCITLIHGPSKGGKTAFCLGLCRSFQAQGHFTVYVDAEHTLDEDFVPNCGVDPNLLEYLAPETYEETTEKVATIINNFKKGKKDGTINKSRSMIIVVDSMSKLVPKDILETLKDVDRGFPIKALFNAVWLDKLTPIVAANSILFVILAHEKEKLDATKFEEQWRITGGGALIYDSTIQIRIKICKKNRVKRGGKSIYVSTIHDGVILKNKKGISHEVFKFVMGRGKGGYPIGVDPISEIVEEAKLRGIDSPLVRKTGGKWFYDNEHLITGDEKFISYLRERPNFVDELYTVLNATAIDLDIQEEKSDDG